MKTFRWLLVAAMAMPICGTVHAQLLLYDLKGTVDSLFGDTALFGAPDAGASFELRYLADYSVGYRNGGGGAAGSSNYLTGGTAFAPDPAFPTIQISPISATLEINGHELSFSGDYFGQVFYTESFASGFSSADLTAQSNVGPDGIALNDVTTHIDTDNAAIFGSVDAPGSFVIDGQILRGAVAFAYAQSASGDAGTAVSGNLTPTSYSVTSAVPEPSSATYLLIGGAALFGSVWTRRRRGPFNPSRLC